MNISREHFVSDNAHTEFQRGIDVFYDELFRFNTTTYILERIFEFPFDLFADIGEVSFFNMIVFNFFNAAILSITRLVTDTEGEGHCFRVFRGKLTTAWIKPEYKQVLHNHLRKIHEYERGDIEILLNKLELIRDKYVAHLSREYVSGEIHFEQVELRDLLEIRDGLNEIFHILRLDDDSRCMLLPFQYDSNCSHGVGVDPRSDIELILDDIVQRSVLLHMPETNPIGWQFQRTIYSENEIDQINHYRRKFGLPEV
jgi:hypothetical protein